MKLSQATAAYGLFHLAFANLEQQLAVALWSIKQIMEPSLRLEEVFKMRFSDLRKELKKELKRFDGQPSTEAAVQDLRRVCAEVGSLSTWRNERAHAWVQIDDNGGISIYDRRTGRQLTINDVECADKIEEAISRRVTLDFNVNSLLRTVESDRKVDQ